MLYALQRELDVHLGKSGQDVLARRLGALQLERGILIDHAPYRVEDLLFLAAGLGTDRERRRRLGKLDRLEGHRSLGLAKRVEGRRIAELGDGDDIPGDGLVDRFALLADEV
jgi:hypothetical protein